MRRLLLVSVMFCLAAVAAAQVNVLYGASQPQSRDSAHTVLIETQALLPSQVASVLRNSCCIATVVGQSNRLIITVAPQLLPSLLTDIDQLDRAAQAGNNLDEPLRQLAKQYQAGESVIITPQVSASETFVLADSRLNLGHINAVLTHFPQSSLSIIDGRYEVATMAVNTAQVKALLAAVAASN